MLDALRLSMVVMLAAGGLFTGGVTWYAWEGVWIWRRLTLLDYAVDFRRSVRRADPALPILLVISATAGGTFAALAGGTARPLAIAAIVLLAVVLITSIVLAEPINSQFRRRAEGVVPPDAERLRRRWRRFHLIRTALVVTAFCLMVIAVSYA